MNEVYKYFKNVVAFLSFNENHEVFVIVIVICDKKLLIFNFQKSNKQLAVLKAQICKTFCNLMRNNTVKNDVNQLWTTPTFKFNYLRRYQ